MKWLRGPGFDVTPELQALKKAQVSSTIQYIVKFSLQGKGASNSSMLDTLKTFRFPGAYKPLLVLIFVPSGDTASGHTAATHAALPLLKQ